jgi:hypothetical protein
MTTAKQAAVRNKFKKVIKKAKEIRKKSPGKAWKTCVKEAWAKEKRK